MAIILPTLARSARLFAQTAHDSIGQNRKYSGEPYWVHTNEVQDIVASVTDDIVAIVAAPLHDILEDVFPKNSFFSLERIRDYFGEDVADRVFDLTDQYTHENYPDWNRKTRKRKEAERLSLVGPTSQTIKLADLISNSRDIVANDAGFARTYLREKRAILDLLPQDLPLWAEADRICREGYVALDIY